MKMMMMMKHMMKIMIQERNTKNNLYKTKVLRFGFFITASLAFISCQDKVLSARQIVEKSIEAHGGMDTWKNVKQLSFDKETALFFEDGSVEVKTDQFQLFRFQPVLFGKIEWESDANDIVITYDNEKIYKAINDSIITSSDELERAKNSFFAAQYVIVQPFALLDKDVELTLKGQIEIENKKVYEISVKYPSDTEASNKWSYFFDTESFEIIANKVELSDHTSWVEKFNL